MHSADTAPSAPASGEDAWADTRRPARTVWFDDPYADFWSIVHEEDADLRLRAGRDYVAALRKALAPSAQRPAGPALEEMAGPRHVLSDLMSVDVHALSALHAQIPSGPYQAMRCGDGVSSRHEVRALDTRPDDNHHWPFRLLESISGQHAGCDEAVFDFVAGVINAWPLIAELCEEGLIARTRAASGAEVKDALRAEGEDPDEAVAHLDRIAREAFAAHGFAHAVEGVVTGRCLDITGEITLDRGCVTVSTPLSDADRSFAVRAWNAYRASVPGPKRDAVLAAGHSDVTAEAVAQVRAAAGPEPLLREAAWAYYVAVEGLLSRFPRRVMALHFAGEEREFRDRVEKTGAALDAALASGAAGDGWSFDMEAAPRDGTPLLCVERYDPKKVVDMQWQAVGSRATWRGSLGQYRSPVCWRLTPPAPAPSARGGDR